MFNFFQKNNSPAASALTKLTLTINGMHCTSCSLNIDGALEDLEGVSKAETNFAKSQTKVEYDSAKVSEKALMKAITDLGYGVAKS